jgi:hypothetical protein
MLLFSLAFSVLLSGYDAYINACSSQGDSREFCQCQADFLALELSDDKIFELAVAGSNAMSGRNDRLKKMANQHPDILIAVEKLEKQSAACGQELN